MDKVSSQKLSEISQIFISLDFARNQALILSFLIMEKRGAVSFSRIVRELEMSKASVSMALRALEEKQLLHYQRQADSRERQIVLHLYGISAYLTQRMQVLKEMRVLFEQMSLWHQEDPAYGQEFLKVANLYKDLDRAVMKVLDSFEGGLLHEKE